MIRSSRPVEYFKSGIILGISLVFPHVLGPSGIVLSVIWILGVGKHLRLVIGDNRALSFFTWKQDLRGVGRDILITGLGSFGTVLVTGTELTRLSAELGVLEIAGESLITGFLLGLAGRKEYNGLITAGTLGAILYFGLPAWFIVWPAGVLGAWIWIMVLVLNFIGSWISWRLVNQTEGNKK